MFPHRPYLVHLSSNLLVEPNQSVYIRFRKEEERKKIVSVCLFVDVVDSSRTYDCANSTGRTVAVRPLPSFLCDSVSRRRTDCDSFRFDIIEKKSC